MIPGLIVAPHLASRLRPGIRAPALLYKPEYRLKRKRHLEAVFEGRLVLGVGFKCPPIFKWTLEMLRDVLEAARPGSKAGVHVYG